jgi:hypothetical protein
LEELELVKGEVTSWRDAEVGLKGSVRVEEGESVDGRIKDARALNK